MFEKAGVNMSAMWGEMSEEHVKALRSRGKDISLEGTNNYFTTGILIICLYEQWLDHSLINIRSP